MPSSEIWMIYPAMGVVVALLGVIGLGARTMWKEYKTWQDEQDVKRSEERKTQRQWEEAQDAKRAEERKVQRQWEEAQDALRDGRWQGFVSSMQERHEADSAADRIKLGELADVIRKLVEQVAGMNTTLTEHILEDSARFDVLLTERQKAAIDSKTQPRRK